MQRVGEDPRFDPTQYVQEQRERRRLMTARLHQGLPAADTRSRNRRQGPELNHSYEVR